jgi:phenylacetate-CoA ligase
MRKKTFMKLAAGLRRHLFFAGHEALLRRSTLRCARELETSQWNSPAQIRELQRAKLSRLLEHAQEHVPFYRKKIVAAGVDVRSSDSMSELQRLPFLSKKEIRDAGEKIVWRSGAGGLSLRSTGGSTGEPLHFFLDRRRQAYDQAARMRSHRWFGVELGEREVLLWGSPIELNRTGRVRHIRDRLFNQHLLDAFAMSELRMGHYLHEWDRLRPAALFGYPSSIALMVRHARATGRRLNTTRLRAVFVTGEVCYPQDRREIEEFFGVPVADGYGSREAGFIAHQCEHGSMHVTAENVIVEILREGQLAEAGECGEIVVTHLDAYAMPFIRYRTGDVGRLLPGRCRCGRGLPLMDVVQGRSTDFLVMPDGTIKHALSIIYPLREMDGVDKFRVTQAEDLGVTVEVVAARSACRLTVEGVERRVRPVVGADVRLGVRFVDSIEDSASGKFRHVVSHAKRPHEAV